MDLISNTKSITIDQSPFSDERLKSNADIRNSRIKKSTKKHNFERRDGSNSSDSFGVIGDVPLSPINGPFTQKQTHYE